MGVLLDPNKKLLRIELYYIEEIKPPHNVSFFHFIKSSQEMESWKQKGYKMLDKNPPANTPGMPVEKYIQKLTVTCRRITWKDQNSLWSQTTKLVNAPDGKTSTTFDGIKYRETKLKMILKAWDLKDEDGQEIPCDDFMIDNLDPQVAQEILAAFEKISEPSDNDLKN